MMYKLLGNRLILNEELVGTFTKDELIAFLLEELNEVHAELNEIIPEFEEMQSIIDDLERENASLLAEIEEYNDEPRR